jgi:hypothetical protein
LSPGTSAWTASRAFDDLREPGHHVKIIVQPAAG